MASFIQVQGKLNSVPEILLHVLAPVEIKNITLVNQDSVSRNVYFLLQNKNGVNSPVFTFGLVLGASKFIRDTDFLGLNAGSSLIGYCSTANVVSYIINGEYR